MPTEVFVRSIDEQVGDLRVTGRLQVETPPYDGSGKFRDMELGKRRADVLVRKLEAAIRRVLSEESRAS